MNEEIRASYIHTVDELTKAHESHRRAVFRRPFRVGLVFLSLMAIFAGWCSYRSDGWSFWAVGPPLVGVYFLVLRRYDAQWAVRRRFRNSRIQGQQIVWKLDEDGIRVTSADSDVRANWRLFGKVRKAGAGFLLYTHDHEAVAHWLPVTAFADDDSLRQAEELLRNKVRDFAEIR